MDNIALKMSKSSVCLCRQKKSLQNVTKTFPKPKTKDNSRNLLSLTEFLDKRLKVKMKILSVPHTCQLPGDRYGKTWRCL